VSPDCNTQASSSRNDTEIAYLTARSADEITQATIEATRTAAATPVAQAHLAPVL